MYGILMICYMMVDGKEVAVKGRQTADRGIHDALFYPDAEHLPAVVVPLNSCKYLEQPETAAVRMLAQDKEYAKIQQENAAWLAKGVDKIIEGDKDWCRFDGYGRGNCVYDSMEQCLAAVQKMANRREFTCNRNRFKAK